LQKAGEAVAPYDPHLMNDAGTDADRRRGRKAESEGAGGKSTALLAGRGALVTGGGSGIGRATARRFAEHGARVAVVDRDGDAADAVAKEIDGAAYALDVTDYDALASACNDAAARFGGLSYVYNNAGIGYLSPIDEFPLDEWKRVVDVNLNGVFHGIRAAAPLLRAAGGGAIVNTASISGTRPAAGEAPYSAAKAGVAALTASAALELAPHVRVNAVSPGMIHTTMTDPLLNERGMNEAAWMVGKTPLARIGTPEDIADVVLFLCSDLARFVTGQNIVVDGGMTLHGSGVDGLLDKVLQLLRPR
jgi:NAD(P)-dependent dehydrogenase (short-subunit alcohol dehydrogenase family)